MNLLLERQAVLNAQIRLAEAVVYEIQQLVNSEDGMQEVEIRNVGEDEPLHFSHLPHAGTTWPMTRKLRDLDHTVNENPDILTAMRKTYPAGVTIGIINLD